MHLFSHIHSIHSKKEKLSGQANRIFKKGDQRSRREFTHQYCERSARNINSDNMLQIVEFLFYLFFYFITGRVVFLKLQIVEYPPFHTKAKNRHEVIMITRSERLRPRNKVSYKFFTFPMHILH